MGRTCRYVGSVKLFMQNQSEYGFLRATAHQASLGYGTFHCCRGQASQAKLAMFDRGQGGSDINCKALLTKSHQTIIPFHI